MTSTAALLAAVAEIAERIPPMSASERADRLVDCPDCHTVDDPADCPTCAGERVIFA